MKSYLKNVFFVLVFVSSTILYSTSVHAKYLVDDAYYWLIDSFSFSDSALEETSESTITESANAEAALSGTQVGNEFFGLQNNSEAEEQRRLHLKFANDKKKINLAITNTKKLIEQSQERAYLPELYLRLSELYIEKSRIVYFLRKTEPDAVKGAKLSSIEANTLKIQAIEVYKRIISHYPNYKHLDKVHFFMAHEFRELNRIPEMVAQYRSLIKKYPNSEYVSESLLLLGDYFMNEAQLDMAKRQYEAVLKYPNSSAVDIARYKLAWVHINKKDFGPAIKLLEESVSGVSAGLKADVDTYNRVDIRLESLNDMAFSYSEFYKKSSPQDAVDYFKKYAWSRPAYVYVVEKLAYRFLIKKKWQHAAYLYRELSALQHDPSKLLEYAENIFICVNESESYDDADQDVRIIVEALKQQRYTVHIEDKDKLELMKRYELYARDVSTKLHDKSQKTGLQKDYETSVDAYKTYLDFFDDAYLKNSLVYNQMEENYAETLFSAQDYSEAGKIFERVANKIDAKTHPKKKERHLYSATLSYYSALKERENLNYFQITQARSGLQDTGTLFASLYPKSKHVSNVLFNVAWIKHDEGKYRDSIAGFRDFVARYPKGKEAEFAVQLIVDAYHTLEDYEGLSTYGAEVVANTFLKQAIRTEVATIVKAAESKIISGLIISSVEDWDTGKNEMQDYALLHRSTALGEQALNALFVASKENNDLAEIQSAGRDFITHYRQSDKVENILKVMIETAVKSGQYRTLVWDLEAFAERFPKQTSSVDFLYQAAQLRQNMQQYQLANQNYTRLLTGFKTSKVMQREMVLSIARNEKKLGNTTAAINVLTKNRKLYDQPGRLEVDAKVANLYFSDGQYKQARKYQKRALSNYKLNKQYSAALTDEVAEISYSSVRQLDDQYFSLQLKGKINNSIVTSKTSQFEKLQKAYLSVLDYGSPQWSLKACYRLYEGFMEYAKFLKSAPLPELTEEETQEYRQIIAETANEYELEARQYLQTGNDLALKLKSFDPALMQYDARMSHSTDVARNESTNNESTNNESTNNESTNNIAHFAATKKNTEIGEFALNDALLKSLHYQLTKKPEDFAIQLELAAAYQKKQDYAQTIVMVKNLLSREDSLESSIKSEVYTLLGASYVGVGEDRLAKESFSKALESDSNNQDATLNLAALYQHYGHIDEANKLFDAVNIPTDNAFKSDWLHPRAKQLFDARLLSESPIGEKTNNSNAH